MQRLILTFLTAVGLLAGAAASADELSDRAEAALKIADPKERVGMLERELNWGNIVAGYELGVLYRDGKELPQDFERALELFEQAGRPWHARNWHKLGVPKAQHAAGMMYLEGKGAAKDTEAAAEWLALAAEQGHTMAQFDLARLYASPEQPVDPEGAYFWGTLVADKFELDRAQKEEAGKIREESAARLDAATRERLAAAVEGWKPRRMASGW